MSRLSRKNKFKYITLPNKCGIPDLIDLSIQAQFRITEKEYNYIIEKLSDKEIDLLVTSESMKYSDQKYLLNLIEKHLEDYKIILENEILKKITQ